MSPPRHRSSTDDIFTEPQRLHKVLASCGFGSRRAMEEMILAGRITVNREPADVGQKVGPGDEVRINGELVKVRFAEPRVRILMYHKTAGEIVTRDDPVGRPTVFEKLPNIGNGKWIAIGRLDFNTEGLLLFTNSGELANKMMHPRYEVERQYAVRVMGLLTPEQQQTLLTGITLEDGPGKVEKIEDGGGEGSNHWYHVVLKEGRNREVRRLFEALGLTVSRLIRTRYGTVAMPSRVKRGQMLELTGEEVGGVLASAGMRFTGPTAPKQGQGGRFQGDGGRSQGDGGRSQGDGGRSPGQNGRAQGPGGRPHGSGGRHQGQGARLQGQNGRPQGPGRPQGQGGRSQGQGGQGNGPRASDYGPRDRGSHTPRFDAGAAGGPATDAAPAEFEGIEPGNSVHGLPTHGNTPVGKFFSKSHGQHGRPHGQGGPRRGDNGGNAGGRTFGAKGRPAHGKPRHHDANNGRSPGSPYAMTTLTIPGAVPEGLPGTDAPRGKGPGAGQRPRGPGGGPGKKRGRGNRPWRPADSVAPPGNDGPAASEPNRVEDDIGNREARTAKPDAQPGNEMPRAIAPTQLDDDIGNRQGRGRKPKEGQGNEPPPMGRPGNGDDDFGNR